MHALSPVQKAETLLNVRLTHEGPPGSPSPIGPFVTISRESGTGGSALAELLPRRLPRDSEMPPWRIYSGNLIDEMLRTNDLPGSLSRFLPEDRVREVEASIGELIGLHPNLWALIEKTNGLIRQLARAGNAILLGRGASFATQGIPHGIHLRLVASPRYRAKQTAGRRSLSEHDAAAYNAARDAARQRYVRATFGAEVSEQTWYDFVINVERVSLEAIADLVAQRVENEFPARRAEA